MRDALLAVAGNLDSRMGGPAVDITASPLVSRRTIYGFVDRQNLPGMFRTFDFASPDTHSPQRYHTTVPQQALFLLNSPFVREQARALLQRPELSEDVEPTARIGALYRLVYGRVPTPDEVALALGFVSEQGVAQVWQEFAQVLLAANEFFFVD